MNKQLKKSIKQLESLKRDRESFVIGDKEHDEIYLKDIKAIKTILKELERLEENSELKLKERNRILGKNKTIEIIRNTF